MAAVTPRGSAITIVATAVDASRQVRANSARHALESSVPPKVTSPAGQRMTSQPKSRYAGGMPSAFQMSGTVIDSPSTWAQGRMRKHASTRPSPARATPSVHRARGRGRGGRFARAAVLARLVGADGDADGSLGRARFSVPAGGWTHGPSAGSAGGATGGVGTAAGPSGRTPWVRCAGLARRRPTDRAAYRIRCGPWSTAASAASAGGCGSAAWVGASARGRARSVGASCGGTRLPAGAWRPAGT